MTALAYRLATRLNSFRNLGGVKVAVLDAVKAVASVPGISAIELNYPQHFQGDDGRAVLDQARDAGLAVTALNLRWDGPDFLLGAFTNPDGGKRERAIETAVNAVDIAANNAIDHVILWMGPDGFDYPFQADYRQLWEMEVDGFRKVASHEPAVKVSVEYKPNDPRRVSIVRNMGEALLAAADVQRGNFGVTLDFCHALMAGEQPAAAAALAMNRGLLFGVHLNDGYGPADDGLMVGSVHFWQTIELLHELRKGGYQGTIYFDTFPDRLDPRSECTANVRMIERMERLVDRLPNEALNRASREQDAVTATRLVHDLLLGGLDD